MPFDRTPYRTDAYRTAAASVRARAAGRCEHCQALEGSVSRQHNNRAVRVRIQVAHLDHDAHLGNHDSQRMAALCEACHLRYDAEHHAASASRTRARKAIASGQRLLSELWYWHHWT